jgi:uncharacterized tellurite resistance protein B-like protein
MDQNGLQSSPLIKRSLFQRIFRRPVKENAIIEITNLLAEKPIQAVSMPEIAAILSAHGLGFGEARAQFLYLVRKVVEHLGADRELSESDRQDLAHLQRILELSDVDMTEVREQVLGQLYANALPSTLADGLISPDERARLEAIASNFGVSDERLQEIYKSQVMKLLQWTFSQMVTDRRVTDEEDARFQKMAENLGVTLRHDGETQTLYHRFRLLAQIEAGQLPIVSPGITLQRGETCHASLVCTHNEIRKQTKSYRYSGPTASVKIIGNIRWRVGQISVQRITQDVMMQLDSGTLYVTNKRLLFDGAQKSSAIALKKIIRFTVFSDGIKIEKDTGKDQYFIGSGDPEILGAVLERVIAQSR